MVDPILPKVELHLHLDCCLSHQAVQQLRPAVTEEEYRQAFVAPARCSNLSQFLSYAPRALALLQTRDALTMMVEDVFEQLRRDSVLYAELRFAPLLHTSGGLRPEDVVDIIDAATEKMVWRTGIEARLILCTLRHYTEAESLTTVGLVQTFRDRRVVALDLAGDEAGYPLQPHIAAYRYAHKHGLRTTAHAGEARGPESVWETLRALAPERIGHGVRSVEDAALTDHLRRSEVHLEVCPSSNVQIVESIPTWPGHPIDRLRQAGVSVSINTDTRTLTPTTLTREYELLCQHFKWTPAMLLASNVAALRHAFLDEATKASLLARLTAAWRPA